MQWILLVTLLAPFAVGLWALGPGRRATSRVHGSIASTGSGVSLVGAVVLGVLVALGRRPALGGGSAPWFRVDPLTALLFGVVGILGVTIQSYAGRNLDGDPRVRWWFTGASMVVAGSLSLAAAGRCSVLLAGWLVTSGGALVLLGYRANPQSRAAARQAAVVLVVGDLCLVAALALVMGTVGDVGVARIGTVARVLSHHRTGPFGTGDVVAVLLAVAAMARASQWPLPNWLPGTVSAPTPVSALLHAGVVNAGAVVLVRFGAVLALAWPANVLIAVGAVVTILRSAGSLHYRTDVKGSLAASTSAQMGFMLLACAAGAPAVALTHLVGHALYKSARFLGAGDTTRVEAAWRRYRPRGRVPSDVLRVALACVATGALGLWWTGIGAVPVYSADWWFMAAVAGTITVQGCWTWLSGPVGSPAWSLAFGGAVLAVGGLYLAVADGLHRALATVLVSSGPGFVSAPLVLAALGCAIGGAWLALQHRGVGPRLTARLAAVSLPPPAPAPAVRLGDNEVPSSVPLALRELEMAGQSPAYAVRSGR